MISRIDTGDYHEGAGKISSSSRKLENRKLLFVMEADFDFNPNVATRTIATDGPSLGVCKLTRKRTKQGVGGGG